MLRKKNWKYSSSSVFRTRETWKLQTRKMWENLRHRHDTEASPPPFSIISALQRSSWYFFGVDFILCTFTTWRSSFNRQKKNSEPTHSTKRTWVKTQDNTLNSKTSSSMQLNQSRFPQSELLVQNYLCFKLWCEKLWLGNTKSENVVKKVSCCWYR